MNEVNIILKNYIISLMQPLEKEIFFQNIKKKHENDKIQDDDDFEDVL